MKVQTQIQGIIDEIKNGSFANELLAEQREGYQKLKEMMQESREESLTDAEVKIQKLIKMRYEN